MVYCARVLCCSHNDWCNCLLGGGLFYPSVIICYRPASVLLLRWEYRKGWGGWRSCRGRELRCRDWCWYFVYQLVCGYLYGTLLWRTILSDGFMASCFYNKSFLIYIHNFYHLASKKVQPLAEELSLDSAIGRGWDGSCPDSLSKQFIGNI